MAPAPPPLLLLLLLALPAVASRLPAATEVVFVFTKSARSWAWGGDPFLPGTLW